MSTIRLQDDTVPIFSYMSIYSNMSISIRGMDLDDDLLLLLLVHDGRRVPRQPLLQLRGVERPLAHRRGYLSPAPWSGLGLLGFLVTWFGVEEAAKGVVRGGGAQLSEEGN